MEREVIRELVVLRRNLRRVVELEKSREKPNYEYIFELRRCIDEFSDDIATYYRQHPLRYIADQAHHLRDLVLLLSIAAFCVAFVYFAFKLALSV